jgi:pilus assembly protein Flp/PilA
MGRGGLVLFRHLTLYGGIIMKNAIIHFLRDEEGAAAIEYGLLAGLISVMVIGGATLAGTSVQTIFSSIAGALKSSAATAKTAAAATS